MEQLQIRIRNEAAQPTLIYLPGLHGDWTLIGSFRRALGKRARLVEITYPRTLTWSLEDYAEAVENALREKGVERGWLLAESFGSQLVWPLLARKRFQIDGVILAGGFVRHPMSWAVRLAHRVVGNVSLGVITRILFGYAKFARLRFRRAPEIMADIEEFLARRTELDRQAAVHRLNLILQNDFCPVAQSAEVPVYGITGVLDPVVPWVFVRHWLKRNCAALRDYKIVLHADHNVLGTGADASAEQITRWIMA